jgi:2-polyprenyl-3-methyl-5-hydroxy-6-metoxy-1,4-benzoquinol methylase
MQTHRNQITRIVDRVPFICERIAGKFVLDIGCGSWPNTKELREKGELPHDAYCDAANGMNGCDCSEQAIEFLRNNPAPGSGSYNLHDPADFFPWYGRIEMIVCGEVLEHSGNPGSFLDNIAGCTPRDAGLIVTVPNAFAYTAYQRACNNEEWVHEEHVAWYSPATLTQLLERHGWKVTELLGYCPQGELPKGASMLQAAGIIAVCSKE